MRHKRKKPGTRKPLSKSGLLRQRISQLESMNMYLEQRISQLHRQLDGLDCDWSWVADGSTANLEGFELLTTQDWPKLLAALSCLFQCFGSDEIKLSRAEYDRMVARTVAVAQIVTDKDVLISVAWNDDSLPLTQE